MSEKIRIITKGEGFREGPQVAEIEPSLREMQKLVTPEGQNSALIECVYVPELAEHNIDLWVNEEGKFNGCKPNFSLFGGQDVAFGPVFFASTDDEGATVGLSDEQIKIVFDFLGRMPQAIV